MSLEPVYKGTEHNFWSDVSPVGELIVMSILQYGLGLAWRFALACMLLDVYDLRKKSNVPRSGGSRNSAPDGRSAGSRYIIL